METEGPAFIPTTFNPVSTAFVSTPSPQPVARLYSRPPQFKPLPQLPTSQSLPALPVTPRPRSAKKHSPKKSHQPRGSIDSLYDLLADLDESQLSYLVQELNSTTSSNLAVSDAISAFEAVDTPRNFSMPQRTMSKSQKIRLSLQTMFRAPSVRKPQEPEQKRSPVYKRISRPNFDLPSGVTVVDLLDMLEAEFRYHHSGSTGSPTPARSPVSRVASAGSLMTSSTGSSFATPSPTSQRVIRRYQSALDMKLEAERSAAGVEGIGLSLLEPRPTTPACGTPRSARSSPITPMWERGTTPPLQAPPVMLDGIFEVLESK